MAIDEDKYKALQKQVAALKRKAAKAEGVLEEVTKTLQEEYGCATLADAQKLLKKLEKEAAIAEQEFNKALAAFEEEWGEQLANIAAEG